MPRVVKDTLMCIFIFVHLVVMTIICILLLTACAIYDVAEYVVKKAANITKRIVTRFTH